MADEVVSEGLVVADNGLEEALTGETTVEASAETEVKVETEPKTEEVVPQTDEDKRFAAKFAALTRKEKAIRESEKRVNARIKELESKIAAQPKVEVAAPEEPLERRLRKDPFKTLESQGMGYETLTQIALNGGKLTPEIQMQLMREEIEAKYSAQIEAVNKKLEAREQQDKQEKEQAWVTDFKGKIATQISTAANDYELVAAEGQEGVDAVFEIIDAYYRETGEALDIKEAVEAAEEELLEQARKRIGLAKIKKLMGASETKTQEVKPQQVKKPGTTLSNEASQVQSSSGKFLSDDESKKEAAKLIRFNS